MIRQADVFLEGEGKAWLERNRDKIGKRDPVTELLDSSGIAFSRVVEIGCANGWRLNKLRERGAEAVGIDPSADDKDRYVMRATASRLPYYGLFDIVIFGFCLYVVDPEHYFLVVAEADRVLRDGGHLVIHDFDNLGKPAWRTPYHHREGLYSHHVDWPKLWLAHPYYRIVVSKNGGEERVTILRKDIKGAFVESQP